MTRKTEYYKEIGLFPKLPQLIVGSFGLGNAIVDAGDVDDILQSMDEMLTYFTGLNIMCWVTMSPATAILTPEQCAVGQMVHQGLISMRARNPLIILSDQFPGTIDPKLGYGDITLFYDKTIHANRKQATAIGKDMGEVIGPMVGRSFDDRANGRFDRFRGVSDTDPRTGLTYNIRSARSLQLIVGTWQRFADIAIPTYESETFRAPGGNDLNCTVGSKIDQGVFSVKAIKETLNPTEPSVACSFADAPPSPFDTKIYGLSQHFSFQGAAGDTLEIVFRGGRSNSGMLWDFWRQLQVGQTYEASCGLQIIPSAEVLYYEHYIALDIQNAGGSGSVNGRISENMREDHAAGSDAYNVDPNERYRNRFSQSIVEDPCFFPPFTVANTVLGGTWVFRLVLATSGTVIVDFWRMTLRQYIGAPAQPASLILENAKEEDDSILFE